MAGRFTLPRQETADGNGDPLSGAKLYFYVTGTSTPNDTFSDDTLTVANTNPVVADSSGRFGDIFLKNEDYKVTLTNSADVTIYTADPVRAPDSDDENAVNPTTTYVAPSDGADRAIFADATAGAFTVTLPPIASAGSGTIRIKKIDSSANAVTVDGDGSETIDGRTELQLPTEGDAVIIRPFGIEWRILSAPLTNEFIPLPPGHKAGIRPSINTTDAEHDIDITAGSARDATNTANMLLDSALTKRLDSAWAVGTGNGGLDTGSLAADTVYYLWLIKRTDTGVVDALGSLSSTTPTMPASYDKKLLLGSVGTNAASDLSGQLVEVFANGRETFVSGPLDITAAGTLTVTHGMSVKPGTVRAFWRCVTDEHNYTAGQEIPLEHVAGGSSTIALAHGVSMVPTDTEIQIRFGATATVFTILDKTTGARQNPTLASWKLIVRAET